MDLVAEINRFSATTQRCSDPACDQSYRKGLADCVHECPACGLVLDRDINAAINIELEGIELLIVEGKLAAGFDSYGFSEWLAFDNQQPTGTERTSPRGDQPSTLAERMVVIFNDIPRVNARLVNEARSSLRSFPRLVESESGG